MVSEQIRKSGENDEDAVQAQDSGSAANGNGSSATSDNSIDTKTSRTGMPAIPPPPPPSGKPRSELGHKPLAVAGKKPSAPPPPPSIKSSTKSETEKSEAEPKNDLWATDSQEISTVKVDELETVLKQPNQTNGSQDSVPDDKLEETLSENPEAFSKAPEPISEAVEAVSETADPVSETAKPSETVESVSETADSVSKTSEPESETVEPVSETTDSVSKTSEPESDTVEPLSESTEPVSKTVEPESDSVEPASQTADPAAETAEPESESVEPASKMSDPVSKTAEPESESVEPASKTSDPVSKTAEPESAKESWIDLPRVDVDLALKDLGADFGLDNERKEWTDPLTDLDNEFKGLNLDSAPDSVADDTESSDESEDTGELLGVKKESKDKETAEQADSSISESIEGKVDANPQSAVSEAKEFSFDDAVLVALDPGTPSLSFSSEPASGEAESITALKAIEKLFSRYSDDDDTAESIAATNELLASKRGAPDEKTPGDSESEEGKVDSETTASQRDHLETKEYTQSKTADSPEAQTSTGSQRKLNSIFKQIDPLADEIREPISSPSESLDLSSPIDGLFPAELDSLFPLAATAEPKITAITSKSTGPTTDDPPDDSNNAINDSIEQDSEPAGTRPARRSLSSLVAKGKVEKQTYNFSKPAVPDSAAEPAASNSSAGLSESSNFEVGPSSKPERKSKFASLLGSSLGGENSMRDIMENNELPEVSGPNAAVEITPEVSEVEVEPLPEEPEPEPVPEPTPEPTPLGADGLPEPWLNMGKKTSDSLQLPKFEPGAEPTTGTAGGTKSFNANAPKSSSDELQWISTTGQHKRLSEQDLEEWNAKKDTGPQSVIDDFKSEKQSKDSTTSGSTPQKPELPATTNSTNSSPNLGVLQRTTTENWTPSAKARPTTKWDIDQISDLDLAAQGAPPSQPGGQNFSRVIDEFSGDEDILDDALVTADSAEAQFLKGNIIEACRQYHVLIERSQSSEKPDIPKLISWSEALADLYILMDEPASAVSFYHKARMLTSAPEPRRVQKYLSCLLKLSSRYDEEGRFQEAEKSYLEAIKVAGDELDEKDVLHQRINDAYIQHSKTKTEFGSSAKTAAIEEQCTTLRMRAVQGTDKSFNATKKPTIAKEIIEETKLEKSERQEKIRRATGTDIEFQAVKGLEELSGHPMVRVLNSIWVQVILGVMLIMCGLTCMVSLKFTEPITSRPVTVNLKGSYKTAEQLKVVEFKDGNRFGIWDEGAISTGKYKPVRGNTDDLIDLLKGHLRTQTKFYSLDNDLLTDEEGRALYKPDAPERKIIQQMWWYIKFATWHYKEKHCYLTSSNPWNRVNKDFTYVNPFTGKPTYATVISTQGAGNKLLPLAVASGQMYEGEPPAGPGAIRCVCFDKVRFFVRGFDRNGKMIQGREPGKAYVLELTDGENMMEKYMASVNTKNKPPQGKTPIRIIVVTEKKDLAGTFASVTKIAPACILVFLFLSVAVTVITLVAKKSKLKWYHYISTSVAIILTIGWFGLALG